MEINAAINDALLRIKPETVFRLANEARPNSDYIFANYLPERTDTSYEVSSATMSIRSTMAGMVAMDSPYPPGGVIQMSQFLEKIAKFAVEQSFPEATQRKLQEIIRYLAVSGTNPISTIIQNLYNFTDKLLVQPHLDTMEWLRGQALVTGGIDWQFGDLNLKVDYGIPSAAFLANRTGNDAYGGSASKFWTDIRAQKSYLRYDVNAYIVHPDLLDVIVSNPANNIVFLGQSGTKSFTIGRNIATISGGQAISTDPRDTVTLIAYGAEAEVLDTANPGKTKLVRFMPAGKMLAIGNNTSREFALINGVNQGSTANPLLNVSIGYTHLGPTVEGNGAPGRWARIFRPEERPWSIVGQSVQNALPVIENPIKQCIASTDMP